MSTTQEAAGLNAGNLLEAVYETLQFGGTQIGLPKEVHAEIANDSDYHRTRQGFTAYSGGTLRDLGGKHWLLALGHAMGAYPARPYWCDIAAIELPRRGTETGFEWQLRVQAALASNTYYHHSLIVAMSSGSLATTQQGMRQRFASCDIKSFVAAPAVVTPDLFTLDLRPVVTSGVKYKPEFADVLVHICEEFLAA